ncbi:MAG: D-2-hydroxyacid dehydrogenase [Acidobacteriota bacterium]
MALTLLVLADPKASWLKLFDSLDAGVTVIVTNDEDHAKDSAPKADALLNGMTTPRLLSVVVPLLTRARWIHSMWAGLDAVWSPELRASTLPLTNGRGVFRVSLAEWTIGAMLHFSYDMRRMIRQQEARTWEVFTTTELAGKTLGVIGYGAIGRATAERAKAFGMRVLALRRRPELSEADPFIDENVSIKEINRLMSASDYVQVAAPLTDETRGMVGPAQVAAMKPTAVIINVGRGAVIDESALADALKTNKIRGAALDVFALEPLPADHAFWGLPNLLLSPHTADHTPDFVHLGVECFLDNLRRFRAEEPLLNIVDRQAGY